LRYRYKKVISKHTITMDPTLALAKENVKMATHLVKKLTDLEETNKNLKQKIKDLEQQNLFDCQLGRGFVDYYDSIQNIKHTIETFHEFNSMENSRDVALFFKDLNKILESEAICDHEGLAPY